MVITTAKLNMKKKKKEVVYPWPKKMNSEDLSKHNPLLLSYMCRFKPLSTPPKLVPLPSELPLIQIQNKIQEVFFVSLLISIRYESHSMH